MPPLSALKIRSRFSAAASAAIRGARAADSENIDPSLDNIPARARNTRSSKTRDEVAHLKLALEDSLARSSALAAEVSTLVSKISALEASVEDTSNQLARSQRTLETVKRERGEARQAFRQQTEDLQECSARLTRVKRLKKRMADDYEAQLEDLRTQLSDSTSSHELAISQAQATLEAALHQLSLVTASRDRLRAAGHVHCREKARMRKQVSRALITLRAANTLIRELELSKTFDPKIQHHYSPTSRHLSRQLQRFGVKPRWINDAVSAVATAFGMKIKGRFMSRRTAGVTNLEGGVWSFLQLGREIKNCMAFICSSDGTTHKKIQYESTSVSYFAPTYAPGVDDTDTTTWKPVTRMVGVHEALRHTAEAQREGKNKLGDKIVSLYNSSPLAKDEKMRENEWVLKQVGQSKDHAADGMKELRQTGEQKEREVLAMLSDERAVDIDFKMLLLRVMSLTHDEMKQAVGKDRSIASITHDERCKIAVSLLKEKLAHDAYKKLRADRSRQAFLTMFIFGGCGSHKDLNAFKYGTDAISVLWASRTLESKPPIELPNKANDAVLQLGDKAGPDARLQALKATTGGGVKCAATWGAVFRNKDDKKGYQEQGRTLVHALKVERHGASCVSSANIADTNNTRYQSHGKTAVELVTYDYEYRTAVETICQAKTNAGEKNHMEEVALRALDCLSTIMDLIAMGLYMVTVSEPYMAYIRGSGNDGQPRNLIDTTDVHRSIPAFCDTLAEHPERLFDDEIPSGQLTLLGAPVNDMQFLAKARELRRELGDDLLKVVAAMFRGAAQGWRNFTTEFAPGGPIDLLTPEQRLALFIPATNDHNEGALGSWRLYIRRNPCSTTASFSAFERMKRNDTEAFVEKVSTEELERWVMDTARTLGSSGETARFKKALAAEIRERADAQELKKAEAKQRVDERRQHLDDVGLNSSPAEVAQMGVRALREQLEIYRDVLGDEITKKMRWTVELKNKELMRAEALAALERHNRSQIDGDPDVEDVIHLASDTGQQPTELLPSPMEVDPSIDESISRSLDEDAMDDGDVMDEEFF